MSEGNAEDEESIRRINKVIEDLVCTSTVTELPTTNSSFILHVIGLDLISKVRSEEPEDRGSSE